MTASPIIVGAGLSGLIAAHAWPRATVLEREAIPRQQHKAVLRFRGDAISALTGIEFRKVTVRKALWSDGAFRAPTLRHANSYSAKVLGRIENDRSIWSLDPVERWVAPEDFYQRLVESVGSRVQWGVEVQWGSRATAASAALISTAPLPVTLKALGLQRNELRFEYSPITVRRYAVDRCDVFQTIYFPDPDTRIYRASITGNLMIVESIGAGEELERELEYASRAFGIQGRVQHKDSTNQKYGKIAPIDSIARRALLLQLTTAHGIYSLGRFATWRNVLLDDLVHDIAVLRKLIAGDHYTSRIAAAS